MPTYAPAQTWSDSGGIEVSSIPAGAHRIDLGVRFNLNIPSVSNLDGITLGKDTPIITALNFSLPYIVTQVGASFEVYMILNPVIGAFTASNPAANDPATGARCAGNHLFVGGDTPSTITFPLTETFTASVPIDEVAVSGDAPRGFTQGFSQLTMWDGSSATVPAHRDPFGGYGSAIRSGRWTGDIGFYIRAYYGGGVGTLQFVLGSASITTTEIPQFTGLAHTREGVYERAIKCARCGTITQEDMIVFDGYKRELKVCRDCYDPPQRPGRGIRGYTRGF